MFKKRNTYGLGSPLSNLHILLGAEFLLVCNCVPVSLLNT